MSQRDDSKSSWAEICERHHDVWVLLAEVESDDALAITFARVVDHDESMIDIMDRNEPLPGTTLIQTASQPLWWLTRPHLTNPRARRGGSWPRAGRDVHPRKTAPLNAWQNFATMRPTHGSGRTCPDEETR